jgi:uncharacterized RDD family membrane protein YckC
MASNNSQFDVNHWIFRWIAAIIDSIIPFVVGYVIFYIILAPMLWTVNLGFLGAKIVAVPFWASLLYPFIAGLIWVLYSAFMEASWNGQTIGKKVLSLQVQMVNGGKVDFGKAFTRNISKIYGLLLLIDWILGIATQGSDKRQRYFDRIAGTTVVSIKQATPPPPPPPPPPPT